MSILINKIIFPAFIFILISFAIAKFRKKEFLFNGHLLLGTIIFLIIHNILDHFFGINN